MEASQSNSRIRINKAGQAGFSMIEMMIATVILSVGLLSLAGLISKMDLTTHESRYASTAALLCSEKLEELGALSQNSDDIRIFANNVAGSLTENKTFDVGGKTISYFDNVIISVANGSIQETRIDSKGKYTTIKQTPDGVAEQTQDEDPPVQDENTSVFTRRWLIEDNVAGFPSQVRRITVRVEYPEGNRVVTFQMTMVRNAQV